MLFKKNFSTLLRKQYCYLGYSNLEKRKTKTLKHGISFAQITVKTFIN